MSPWLFQVFDFRINHMWLHNYLRQRLILFGDTLFRNRTFPHSNKQWRRVEVRVDKNTVMYENAQPSLAFKFKFSAAPINYMTFQRLILSINRRKCDTLFTKRSYQHSYKLLCTLCTKALLLVVIKYLRQYAHSHWSIGVEMRVCKHGCDVTLSVFPRHNLKPFQSR